MEEIAVKATPVEEVQPIQLWRSEERPDGWTEDDEDVRQNGPKDVGFTD